MFYFVLHSVCTTLASPKIGCTSGKKAKTSCFALLSTRFALSLPSAKIGCTSAIKIKISDVLFCIALGLHYLCNILCLLPPCRTIIHNPTNYENEGLFFFRNNGDGGWQCADVMFDGFAYFQT